MTPRIRIFRYARFSEVEAFLAVGWFYDGGIMHAPHGCYAVTLEWLCGCCPVEPVRMSEWTAPALDLTRAERLASIQRLADELTAEVRACADEQTLSEHIRDRGEWSGLELDARRLRDAFARMAERERGRTADLFEGASNAPTA